MRSAHIALSCRMSGGCIAPRVDFLETRDALPGSLENPFLRFPESPDPTRASVRVGGLSSEERDRDCCKI